MTKIIKFLLYLFLLLLMLTQDALSSDSILLEELIEPNSITVDHQNMNIYIPEATTIFIYDLKNFKLKKQFGKKGEGPREFLLDVMRGVEELLIDIRTPVLMVNSLGKISFFNKKDCTYIREIKSNSRAREFRPLGNGYAGQGMTIQDGIQYRSINIYDSKLNKVKEVFKVRHHFQLSEGLKVLPAAMTFATHNNKLFIAWEEDLIVRVYNQNGNHLYNIQKEYERVNMTDQFKKNVETFFRLNKRYKRLFELLDPELLFPDKLPAIADLKIDEGKLYVLTYRINEKKANVTACLVFDVRGKFLKELNLPIRRQDELLPYPYSISRGKLYQLIEDGEYWRLKITRL